MSSRLKRRALLAGGLAGTAAVAAGAAPATWLAMVPVPGFIRERFATELGALVGGRVSLADDRALRATFNALFPSMTHFEACRALSKGSGLAELVRQRALEDFHQGRVQVVSGWRVSETEARLLALLRSV
jgi:hypothetical protein